MWWIGPMWPKCAFGDQKGLIRNKVMPFGNPPYHGTKTANLQFFYFLDLLLAKKWYFGSENGVFLVFWTRCDVSDIKQTQKSTAMDYRNKIQSLVLPTDAPGDAPDCITEYGPCTCEYGRMCHTAPTAQKYGFSPEPKLHLAFLVRPKPSNSMPATKYGQQHKTRKITPVGPKKGSKF